jgi:hypothetical protein
MSDSRAVRLLKRELRDIFKQSGARTVFLELYAGHGGVSKHLRRKGAAVMEFEIDRGAQYDLTRKGVRRLLLGWLRSGVVRGAWLGTICKSWSRARRGPPGSSWGPIRSAKHIYGLPGLPASDRSKILLGNVTMRQTAEFIHCCTRHHVPVILENPVASMLWLAPPIRSQLNAPSCQVVSVDQCQFGARWRKRTRLASWHCPIVQLQRLCSGRKGVCNRTDKPHIVLSGTSKERGVLWTALAQTYPDPFCRAGAGALHRAAEENHLLRLKSLGQGIA